MQNILDRCRIIKGMAEEIKSKIAIYKYMVKDDKDKIDEIRSKILKLEKDLKECEISLKGIKSYGTDKL